MPGEVTLISKIAQGYAADALQIPKMHPTPAISPISNPEEESFPLSQFTSVNPAKPDPDKLKRALGYIALRNQRTSL